MCVDCYPSKKDRCLNLNPTRSAPSVHLDENDHPPSSDPDPDHEALNVVNSNEPVSGTELNSEFELPAYKPATTARFMWGALDSTEVSQKLDLVLKLFIGKKIYLRFPLEVLDNLLLKNCLVYTLPLRKGQPSSLQHYRQLLYFLHSCFKNHTVVQRIKNTESL